MQFRHLLVPHDFSDHADSALRVAAKLARRPGGRLTVIHVITPVAPITDVPLAATGVYIDAKELVAGARAELERRVKKVAGRSTLPRIELRVVIGSPHLEIVEAGRGSDAIVMSTAGRTGLSHLLIGSVAEKVVRHATVPVITFRPTVGRKAAGPVRKTRRSTS